MKASHKIRAFLIAVLLVGGLAALLVRLFFLQVVWHEFFLEKAFHQQRLHLTIQPKRGKIVDRKMRDLAISVPVKSFYVVPHEVKDSRSLAVKLSNILDLGQEHVKNRLDRKKNFVWLKRRVSEKEAEEVLALRAKGIYFLEESKRVYPGDRLLSHVLGFTDLDENGLEGIEKYYDKYLKGKPGWRLSERDAAGREVMTSRRYEIEPRHGMNLVLTIDATIQTLAQKALSEVVRKFEPVSATLVIMSPQTGEVLALANQPDFDPNHAAEVSAEVRRNRAVTDFFEPGSTFKPFIAASALQEKAVHLTDQFYCEEGAFRVGRHTLHDVHEYGNLSVREIVAKSSNIGMAKIGYRLGGAKIYEYVKKFGFGSKTGVDLPGEVAGWLHPMNRWSKLTPYMLSMGQEITVTGIQLAAAYCTLANGGRRVRPHVVRQMTDHEDHVIFQAEINPGVEVLSSQTVDQITDAMQDVVSEEGTGMNADVEGYAVAGKTGTAQKASPAGGYSHTEFVSSFVGFLPADRPQAVIAVIVNEPHHFHYGGTVAAPAFREIGTSLMRYFEVIPDRVIAKNELEE